MKDDNLVLFPTKETEEDLAKQVVDALDDLEEAILTFSKRLGGVNLEDLEDGNDEALQLATRSLRKEFIKLSTADLYRS